MGIPAAIANYRQQYAAHNSMTHALVEYMRISIIFALLILLLFPLSGEAHTRLIASSPSANQTLSSPPTEIHFLFSDAIEKRVSRLEIKIDGKWSPLNTTIKRKRLVAKLPALASGRYVVRWSVFSTDGHMQHGKLSFSVKLQ